MIDWIFWILWWFDEAQYLTIKYRRRRTHQSLTLTSDPLTLWPLTWPLQNRGGLHAAAVLGATAVGGPGSPGLPALPVAERVAAQGEPEPQDTALLQQGEGKSPTPVNHLSITCQHLSITCQSPVNHLHSLRVTRQQVDSQLQTETNSFTNAWNMSRFMVIFNADYVLLISINWYFPLNNIFLFSWDNILLSKWIVHILVDWKSYSLFPAQGLQDANELLALALVQLRSSTPSLSTKQITT